MKQDKSSRMVLAVSLLMVGLAPVEVPWASQLTEASNHTSLHAKMSLPFPEVPRGFEVNRGQSNPDVKFLSRGPGYTMFLTQKGAVLALQPGRQAIARSPLASWRTETGPAAHGALLRMIFDGANTASELTEVEQLAGRSHYFIGSDPARWRRNVPRYARVRQHDVYAGVDLLYYGNRGQLEYDLIVAPGADPGKIRMTLEGADSVSLDSAAGLVLRAGRADVRLRKPVIYQTDSTGRRDVNGRYRLTEGNRVVFEVGAYDPGRPLVIDPVLVYSTYLGGPGNDGGSAIAADQDGNAYVVGSTTGDFPTSNALEAQAPGLVDVFVAKFDQTGTLLFSTYLGGSDSDQGYGIAVDATGVYVTGSTYSTDFPVVSPLQPTLAGGQCSGRPCRDAFIAKLDPTGSELLYSTYYGSPNSHHDGFGVAVGSDGSAYVGGRAVTGCDNLCSQGFVARISPGGSALVFSRSLGATGPWS